MNIDRPLDDIIMESRPARRGGRRRRGGRPPGTEPYNIAANAGRVQKSATNGRSVASRAVSVGAQPGGSKIVVSNLEYNVTESDLKVVSSAAQRLLTIMDADPCFGRLSLAE